MNSFCEVRVVTTTTEALIHRLTVCGIYGLRDIRVSYPSFIILSDQEVFFLISGTKHHKRFKIPRLRE